MGAASWAASSHSLLGSGDIGGDRRESGFAERVSRAVRGECGAFHASYPLESGRRNEGSY